MCFGDRIKEIRKFFHLTQKDMAKSLEISQAYLCNIELGKNNVNAKIIFKLTNEFGVKTLWLAEGVGEMFAFPLNRIADIKNRKIYSGGLLNEIRSKLESGRYVPFTVDKDNMENLFRIGDMVLIDISDRKPKNQSVYLFRVGSELVLKHCIGDFPVKLANDKTLLENLECIGRAVWLIKKV